MKQIYITGDSFGVLDPEWGDWSWVSQLSNKLGPEFQINNLSMVCASNLLISLQVDKAIDSGADYVIMLATSSTREDVKLIQTSRDSNNLLDRFHDITDPCINGDLVSFSYASLDDTTVFTEPQLIQLRDFSSHFVDLDLLVYRNKCIIESTLEKLVRSKIPFMFDQGGFEHKFYSDSECGYFQYYAQYKTDINLWDYVPRKMKHRPYFHITDPDTHAEIARYFATKILEEV